MKQQEAPRSGGPTKYEALTSNLRMQIESGALKPGDRLPSFSEMKARHGATPQTTDRVYSLLEREGLIVRTQGVGTFVANQIGVKTGEEMPLIALVMPNLDNLFFTEILRGAETACREAGFHLLLANTRGSSHLEAQHLTSLSGRVAGLCIIPCDLASYETYNVLLQKDVPFVFVDRALDKLHVSLAAADNESIGYEATQHLLSLGHRHIYVLGEGHASSVTERIRGYRRALEDAGVTWDETLVRKNDLHNEAAGYTLTNQLLTEQKQPLALFCINEPIARGAYVALKEKTLSIPENAAIIAVGEGSAELFDPPLSSVDMDLREVGAASVRLLVDHIKRGSHAPVRQIRIRGNLAIRNSSDANSNFCRVQRLLRAVAASNAA